MGRKDLSFSSYEESKLGVELISAAVETIISLWAWGTETWWLGQCELAAGRGLSRQGGRCCYYCLGYILVVQAAGGAAGGVSEEQTPSLVLQFLRQKLSDHGVVLAHL